MICVNTLGSPDYPPVLPASATGQIFSASRTIGDQAIFKRFETPMRLSEAVPSSESSESPVIPASRQWPWRGFAFSSDLGTIGYLVKKPQLAGLGWLTALPYYIFSIENRPKGSERKEEALYQATANGILPFAEAKIGTMAGELLHQRFAQTGKLTRPMSKTLGGLTALLVLTPILGDPISRWLIKRYKSSELAHSYVG